RVTPGTHPSLLPVAPTPATYTLSLHDALPIYQRSGVHSFTVLAFVLAGLTLTVAPLRAQGEEERLPFNASYDGRINLMPTLDPRSEEHTSELQSRFDLVCRLLLEKKKDSSMLK